MTYLSGSIPLRGISRAEKCTYLASHISKELMGSSVVVDPCGGTVSITSSRPGIVPVYYTISNNVVYWGEHEWEIKQKAYKYNKGKRIITKLVKAGTRVIISSTGNVLEYMIEPTAYPEVVEDISLEDAVKQFRDIFLKATEEIVADTSGDIICALSGGTDSTLGLWALRELGIDPITVCVGRNDDDFDVSYAKQYAKDLGVTHYKSLYLPDNDFSLGCLLSNAIVDSEQCEMSNTLMAMCTELIRSYALEHGASCIWKGHYADDIVGLSNTTFGAFKKKYKETSAEWSYYRASLYQHFIPNDIQVSKVVRADRAKLDWRSTFLHKSVREFVWSMPLNVVTMDGRKPLYEGVLDPVIENPAWAVRKKVGYYSGSGISKIRLVNEILSDVNMRKQYKLAKLQRKIV